jgi:hypothetical protein
MRQCIHAPPGPAPTGGTQPQKCHPHRPTHTPKLCTTAPTPTILHRLLLLLLVLPPSYVTLFPPPRPPPQHTPKY